jgi:hypothetical protein
MKPTRQLVIVCLPETGGYADFKAATLRVFRDRIGKGWCWSCDKKVKMRRYIARGVWFNQCVECGSRRERFYQLIEIDSGRVTLVLPNTISLPKRPDYGENLLSPEENRILYNTAHPVSQSARAAAAMAPFVFLRCRASRLLG